MLSGNLASWWDGRCAIDGGEKYVFSELNSFGTDGTPKDEMPGLRQMSESGSDANWQRAKRIAGNDGSILATLSADRLVAQTAIGSAPRVRQQAGTLRMDGHQQGVFDQMTAWRSGDPKAWTISGKPTKNETTRPQRQIEQEYESGNFELFRDPNRARVPNVPPHRRPGGVGRRSHSGIVPYNDGAVMGMQAALRDQMFRERNLTEAHQLGSGPGLRVETVPAAEREAALRPAGQTDQHARWRAEIWDSKPFGFNGSDCDRIAIDPRRRHTDVTFGGQLTPTQVEQGAAARIAGAIAREPNTDWRMGDDLPFTVNGSPARMHENLLSSHQAEWRYGDMNPFRIDGSIPSDDMRAHERAESEANARKHTDIMFHANPTCMALATTLEDARSTTLHSVSSNAGHRARYGPSAAPDSPGCTGMSWGEMRMRGLLQHSASDAVLMPHSTTTRM